MFAIRGRIVAFLFVAALSVLLVPSALAGGTTLDMVHNPVLGRILTDAQGRTLYRFTRDTVNVSSACYNQCATVWPPFLVDAGNPIAGAGVNGNLLGVLLRNDGTHQVMYNGMPLYYYAGDDEAGDIYGQGVRASWFVVKPNTTTVGNQSVSVHSAQNATLGSILTDGRGITLYTFTHDTGALSVCYDGCATVWPPMLVGAVTPTLGTGVGGSLGMILRNDGNHQLTYDGKPLYYFYTDANAGDTKGQGVGNVWFVVHPTAP